MGEEEKKYLIDYFDVEKLRKSKATYEKNQSKSLRVYWWLILIVKIKQKSQEIKENIVEYDNHLKKLEDSVKDNSGEIHALLGDQENLFADIQSISTKSFVNKRVNFDFKIYKDLNNLLKIRKEHPLKKIWVISVWLRIVWAE